MHKPKRLPVLREDRTIEIHLTRGYVAIVDFEDVWAAGHNWSSMVATDDHVYAIGCNGKLLHREILGLGPKDNIDVDHVNGDTLDCRRENLRAVSTMTNSRNRRLNRNNSTGLSGVRRNKSGSWSAMISNVNLGTFPTFELAAKARLDAEDKFWGVQPRREVIHSKLQKVLTSDDSSRFEFQRLQRELENKNLE